MNFLQNFNIKIKLFAGLFLIAIIFIILLFWQFSALEKIESSEGIIQKTNQAHLNLQELSNINLNDIRLLMEIIQSDEIRIIDNIVEDHIISRNKTNLIYDSLYKQTNLIFPNKSNILRIKAINYLDETKSSINNVLNPYFANVEEIKKDQIQSGDEYILTHRNFEDVIAENDSIFNDSISSITVVESLDLTAYTKNVQLIKIYKFYKQNHEQLAKQYNEIDNVFIDLYVEAGLELRANTNKIKVLNSIFTLLALAAIVIIMIIVSNTFTKPLLGIVTIVKRLSEGELPPNIVFSSKDELGQMSSALNKLIAGLKKTSAFATNIGKGDFLSNYSPLSSKDVLGNALLEMRKSLQAANEEEAKRKIEDTQRTWTTEGLAKFGEILRHHTENIKLLSKDIIQNLVKYLKANQGGIFILNDTDKENIFLELISAYAYNREKFVEKKILLGEGLVGAVAIEKYTIYMTELPEEYIEIESGLGGANPKSLLIVPLKLDEEVLGVIEIASFNTFEKYEIQLVERIAESIASTLSTSKINTRTAELLEQSRIQAQEMQEQDEEMRQNMEEIITAQEESLRREEELNKKVDELENMKVNLVERDKKQRLRIEKITTDIEKQTKTRKNLEKQIELTLENSLDSVIMFDESKKVQFFNKTAEELWGFEKAEIIGRNISDLFPEEITKDFDKKISTYFKTKRFDLIEGNKNSLIKTRKGDEFETIMNIQEIELSGMKKLILFIKNLDQELSLTKKLDDLNEKMLLKEFNYSTHINVLENFIKQSGLVIPENLAKESNLINWSDSFSIGLNIIDQQHRKWIDFINSLYKSFKNDAPAKDISEDILKLLDYTDYHFGFEEKYLEDFKCNSGNDHKKNHEKFVSTIKKFQAQFSDGNYDAVYKIIVFLNNWVITHIQGDDKAYVECFKLNGLV
ncbi:MAG: bacteriohemerythrin [Bacteroidales bacterium]|nr:bacteriohemerythrin [Bacteroidales bacterium]MBN2756800.1 bacteriohemerythrin [Bacteroidales bacterium]